MCSHLPLSLRRWASSSPPSARPCSASSSYAVQRSPPPRVARLGARPAPPAPSGLMAQAPRLLASIAADNMLRVRLCRGKVTLSLQPFSKLTAGEPKRALVFTYLFGGAFVLLGSLDAIAPLLSMRAGGRARTVGRADRRPPSPLLPLPHGPARARAQVLSAVLRLDEPQLLRARHPQGPALAPPLALLPLVRRARRLPPLLHAHVHHQLARPPASPRDPGPPVKGPPARPLEPSVFATGRHTRHPSPSHPRLPHPLPPSATGTMRWRRGRWRC